MGALWQSVETSAPSLPTRNNDTVGGAIPCVVGNRVYLVGGSGTATSDPDIALGLFSWSLPSPPGTGQREQHHDGTSNKTTTTSAAAAPTPAGTSLAATRAVANVSATPVLSRLVAYQEGDVPSSRIGHAAVSVVDLTSSISPEPASIILFGGEASHPTPTPSTDADSGSLVYAKFADVYEATPKEPSGTLVWRALTFREAVEETPREASTATAAKTIGGAKNGAAPIESQDVVDVPPPMAFHASCAASVCSSSSNSSSGDTEPAMLIHGGMDQSSQLLGELWAFFPTRRLNGFAGDGKGEAAVSVVERVGSSSGDARATGWERLQPEGEGPPPAAYHSATPVNGGRVVVFIGGGKNWGPSSVFLLDTVGLIWSSFEATGGIGLSGQRCLHTAISVTGVETRDSNDDDQHPEESGAQPTTSVTENAASDDPTSPSTPRERGGKEEAAAPTVQLWGPVVAGAGAVPGSARSAGSEKSAVAAASGKKKPGAKEGSAGSKKKDAVKSETVVGNVVDGSDPDTGGGDPPVFESVLIFGGIVGSAAVSGDATVLRHDGTVAPLRLTRKCPPPPGPRFSHAMVSMPVSGNSNHNSYVGDDGSGLGQVALLFGGCRGDGTRVARNEAFVLDLAGSGGGGTGGAGQDGVAGDRGEGDGLDSDDAQTDKTVTFDGGDVYTGQLDADGRRQGKGCCDYGAASGKAAGEEAMTQSSADGGDGGGGGDGSYSGEWDADEPHGYGERVYPHSREGEGKERGGGGADMATMTAAFGHGCPPLASYRGDFRRGVREGKGVCSFFAPDPVRNAARSASTSRTTSLVDPIPESYDGEWVDGRPMGRGVLTLRRTAAATVAPSSGPYPSSVPGSGSMMMTTRDGTSHGGSSDDGGGGSGGGGRNGSGGSIEGMWTEEGLVHGKEKLPGKGGVYEGQYRLGRREGQGRLELPDGSEYEGAWRNGRQNGIGTFRCGVTRHVYTGKWVGGVRCGRGVCEYASGSRYDGLWLDGLRHGEGVLSNPPGGDGSSLPGLWYRDEFSYAPAGGESRRQSSTEALSSTVLKVVE